MLISDHFIARELFWSAAGEDAHGLEWPDLPRDANCLANVCANICAKGGGHSGSGRGALTPQRVATDAPPDQWSESGAQPMGTEWRCRWSAAADELSEALQDCGTSADTALGYLYARVGHDCGSVLRGLHGRGVSWGTYQDAMCLDGKTVGK